MLTGVGVREIDSEGYGAPLVGFSGSRPRGERIELGVEAFVLLPNELVVAPSPMFIPNDGGLGGATQMSVNNIDVVVLVRMNYWLAPWKVRPYLGIGVGGHVFKSSRVGTRTIHELPDDQPRTITRETQDGGFFLSTLFAIGVDIPIGRHWSVRPEARLPIPTPYMTIHTLGFAVGVSYGR